MPAASNASSDGSACPETVLDYSNAYWGDDKCHEIVDAVRRATYPVQLDLRGNRFEARGAKTLAEMLKTRHNVVSLSLEWNNIGLLDEGVEAIATALAIDSRLLELDLRNNNIGPEAGKALASALTRNRTLKKLDLRWNEIGNAGVLAFLEALQSNHTVVSLELSGNNSSFAHADEIERLLARNRLIREKNRDPIPVVKEATPEQVDPAPREGGRGGDQLLLQILAEKETIETDLAVAKRQVLKLNETIEDQQVQMHMLQKETDSAKEDRARYQQREVDAKAETHDVKMRLEELETRRKMEFDEYRTARSALERECTVLREKLNHFETLHKTSDEQKNRQIAALEETKYGLESEVHRLTLTASTDREEYERQKKEYQDVVRDHERRGEKQRAANESEVAAINRHHEQIVQAFESQAAVLTEQLKESEQSTLTLRDRGDKLQTALLEVKVAHEKEVNGMKKQWETELENRLQQSVGIVESQLEEVKKSRIHLEHEVEKHLKTITSLRQGNITLQEASEDRASGLQQEIDRQYTELQAKQTELGTATNELAKMKEKVHQHQRRIDEQECNIARMRESYEFRLKDMSESAAATATELRAVIKDKTDQLSRLEAQALNLERLLSKQTHEHEVRLDNLAESFTTFIQTRMMQEREQRKHVFDVSRSTLLDHNKTMEQEPQPVDAEEDN